MTVKPTYQMLVLMQRLADGNILAIGELWPLLFDEPLDITRPIEDIGNEIAAKFKENEDPAEVDGPPPEPTPAEAMDDALNALTAVVTALLGAPRKAKK